MDTVSHWKPNDWIRLTALIGGFVLFVLGAVMLYQGVVAQGDIDLRSTFLSGTIKAASAGLYVCFFRYSSLFSFWQLLWYPLTANRLV
jgi:hypothetical protein